MAASITNDGYKSQKNWRDAIRRAVNRKTKRKGNPQWLDVLADRLVRVANKGDVSALKEIGDRLDGKPAQAIAIKGDPDSPVIFNLRLGDGIAPKIIDGTAEITPDSPLTGPLVAITAPDEDSQPE